MTSQRRGGGATAALVVLASCCLGPSLGPHSLKPTYESQGRLSGVSTKREVPCPSPDARIAILAVAGQSNAGNHGDWRPPGPHGDRILNYYGGRCWVASSPLLGGTGLGGAYWDLLGGHLVESGRYDRVLIAPFAVGGRGAAHWGRGGDLHRPLVETFARLQRDYPITFVLWHQGEADYLANAPAAAYEAHIGSLVQALRAVGVSAPFYIANATRCGFFPPWTPEHPIVKAQQRLAETVPGVMLGVDADSVWGREWRYDDCHFNVAGQAKLAQAWFARLSVEPR